MPGTSRRLPSADRLGPAWARRRSLRSCMTCYGGSTLSIKTRIAQVRRLFQQRCRRQYRAHFSTVPVFTIAHDRSPTRGDVHQAAVLFPRPLPSDLHDSIGPVTRMCPSRDRPTRRPTSRTRASRAASALADGHGCFDRHVPSPSRAAIPDSRIRGPSAHQSGPSPSQTRIGVQVKVVPEGTTSAAKAAKKKIIVFCSFESASRHPNPMPR